jgi:hypothetical protein
MPGGIPPFSFSPPVPCRPGRSPTGVELKPDCPAKESKEAKEIPWFETFAPFGSFARLLLIQWQWAAGRFYTKIFTLLCRNPFYVQNQELEKRDQEIAFENHEGKEAGEDRQEGPLDQLTVPGCRSGFIPRHPLRRGVKPLLQSCFFPSRAKVSFCGGAVSFRLIVRATDSFPAQTCPSRDESQSTWGGVPVPAAFV